MAIDAVQSLQAQIARFAPLVESLRQGQVVDARVITMLTDSTARLSLLGQMLDVDVSQSLQPGTTLPLKVDWEGDALRLVLQQNSPQTTGPAASSQVPVTNRPAGPEQALAQARTAATAPTASPADARSAVAAPAAQATLPQTPAALLQGSVPALSPSLVLASTLARNLVTQPQPQPPATGVLNVVPPAIAAVQAASPVQPVASPLQQAAQNQTASPGPQAPPQTAPLTPAAMQSAIVSALVDAARSTTVTESESTRVAVTQGLRQAADKQTSLAPVFASLAALTQQADSGLRPDLPREVLGLARSILGLRLDADRPVTAEAVKTAMAQSGVFLEATLAAGLPVSEDTDLKAALAQLKAHLPQADQPQERQTQDRIPLRGAATQGQPPVPPGLTMDMPTDEALRALREQADSSLARLTITQAAALPDLHEPMAPPRPDQPQQFTVEIPIRYQGETSIAQMQVSRDAPEGRPNASGKAEPRQWTVRFSMDCEPVGPVHASIRLLNDQVGIRLWAERTETVRTFTALAPVLENAMAASSVKFDGLVIAEGRPPSGEDILHAALNPRHMLDKRS